MLQHFGLWLAFLWASSFSSAALTVETLKQTG
jgi:hypothetical protein